MFYLLIFSIFKTQSKFKNMSLKSKTHRILLPIVLEEHSAWQRPYPMTWKAPLSYMVLFYFIKKMTLSFIIQILFSYTIKMESGLIKCKGLIYPFCFPHSSRHFQSYFLDFSPIICSPLSVGSFHTHFASTHRPRPL